MVDKKGYFEKILLRTYRAEAFLSQERKCYWCGIEMFVGNKKAKLRSDSVTADHKLAIAEGGLTVRKNVVAACFACNQRRGAMLSHKLQSKLKQEKDNNIVTLISIPGGKEPPSTTETWLDKLEEGTVFVIQDKQNPQDFALGLFKLVSREGTDGKVIVLVSPSFEKPIYVNPTRFCNRYTLYDTLITIKDEAIQEEAPIEEESLEKKDD